MIQGPIEFCSTEMTQHLFETTIALYRTVAMKFLWVNNEFQFRLIAMN